MAVNKVIFGNVTLIDTSEVTVTPEKMFKGETALGADGEMQTGEFTIDAELTEQDELLTELETVLAGKAAGGGGESLPIQETKNVDDLYFNGDQAIVGPDNGYAAVKLVTIMAPDTFRPENIRSGINMFGLVGTADVGGGETVSTEIAKCSITVTTENDSLANDVYVYYAAVYSWEDEHEYIEFAQGMLNEELTVANNTVLMISSQTSPISSFEVNDGMAMPLFQVEHCLTFVIFGDETITIS